MIYKVNPSTLLDIKSSGIIFNIILQLQDDVFISCDHVFDDIQEVSQDYFLSSDFEKIIKQFLIESLPEDWGFVNRRSRTMISNSNLYFDKITKDFSNTINGVILDNSNKTSNDSKEILDLKIKIEELNTKMTSVLSNQSTTDLNDIKVLHKQQVRMIQLMQSDILEIQNRLKKLEG